MQSNRVIQNIEAEERNKKMASILTLIITISAKIQKIKEKLCGFSPLQFSPESIFEALDLASKGHLDIYDIHSFLGNDNIQDRQIAILFNRLGDQNKGKMTYLGFLNLLKPYFDHELARDLLLRDTYARKNAQAAHEQVQYEIQQAVLVLLNELLFLNCVCMAEHEGLKQTLMDEYMLNSQEISKILGLQSRLGALKAIYQFISCSSQYEVEQNEIKYLLSFLQTSQYTITNQKYINLLFLPSKVKAISSKKQIKVQNIKQSMEKQQLHANYSQKFIGKNDMISNKKSFLNYIHPNSFKLIPEETHRQSSKPIKSLDSDRISVEQHKFPNNSAKLSKQFIRGPHKNPSLKLIQQNSYELDQSIIQASNVYRSKIPQINKSKKDIYLQQSKVHTFQTPILEQFMHPSNIKKNLGHYRGSEKAIELNNIIEHSRGESLEESDAIQRVQTYKNQPVYQNKQQYNAISSNKNSLNIQDSRNNAQAPFNGNFQRFQEQRSSYYNSNRNSYLKNENNNPVLNSKNIVNVSNDSGVLGQFYKKQYI